MQFIKRSIYVVSIAAISAFCFFGCTEKEDIKNPIEPRVGESREGGIISHIFLPGEVGYVEGETHGIVTAPADVVYSSQWGCQGTEVGGTSTKLGKGRLNTELVLAFHDNLPNFYNNPTQCHPDNNGSVAAREALNFSSLGFEDWFMPSLLEMEYLYKNRDQIGGFTDSEYWSSCESNAENACVMSFITGEKLSKPKSEIRRVRVVRFF